MIKITIKKYRPSQVKVLCSYYSLFYQYPITQKTIANIKLNNSINSTVFLWIVTEHWVFLEFGP